MSDRHVARIRDALARLQLEAEAFRERVQNTPSTHELPGKRLRRLHDLAEEIPPIAAALEDSIKLIEQTALDIVDMETRLMGQGKDLARVIRKLGRAVGEQHFIRSEFWDELVLLEEAVQDLAGALFPSAVQGLNRLNRKLWLFSRLYYVRFESEAARVQRDGELTDRQLDSAKKSFARVAQDFEIANGFLNTLARGEIRDRTSLRSAASKVRAGMKDVRQRFSATAEKKVALRPFRNLVKATRELVPEVTHRLKAIRVPLLPTHAALDPQLRGAIERADYEAMPGLHKFALLNIASRLRGILVNQGQRHLLDEVYEITVWRTFPDRLYLKARASFIDDISTSREFGSADPSLHRFKEGSFKQKTWPRGNLQVTYAKRQGEPAWVDVDADINLYREPLRHFFGEVLANHLSGEKTDPYRVREILEAQGVKPIGGFGVASP